MGNSNGHITSHICASKCWLICISPGLVRFLFCSPHKMGALILTADFGGLSWILSCCCVFSLRAVGGKRFSLQGHLRSLCFPLPEGQLGREQRFPPESSAKNTWAGRPKVWIWSVLDSWSDPLSRPGHLSPVPLQLLFSLLPKSTKVSTFPQKVFSNPALESFSRVWAPMRDQVGDNPGLRRNTWGSAASHRENRGATRHPLTWADALMRAGRAIPVLRSLGSLSDFRGPNLNTFGSPEPRKWEHGLGKSLVGNICFRVPWWQSLHQHL